MEYFQNVATRLRIHSIVSTNCSQSGHPTSCSSLAEIFAVLFFHSAGMRYFPLQPQDLRNDKLVLSKGHAAPILYAAWAETGLFPIERLRELRSFESEFGGHPMPSLNFVDAATGSLGQGLSVGCGLAYSMKHYEKSNAKVFVILGDGECAEGSVWEALNFASFYSLNNLIAIVDVNSLGQTGPTMFSSRTVLLKTQFEAFGCECLMVDGHNIQQIADALKIIRDCSKPSVLLAITVKGKDFLHIENQVAWHGKPIGAHSAPILSHLTSKLVECQPEVFTNFPIEEEVPQLPFARFSVKVTPSESIETSTRFAFGQALKSLGNDSRIVCLDADTQNSTMACLFQEAFPQRFVNCFISEQNMVGVALGFSKRQKVPFVSAFAAFLTRACDQIRLCGISAANIKFVGSHSGISVGRDGASQMGLEDLAMFRAVPGCLVLCPCDYLSTFRAVKTAANYEGMVYIRTSRPTLPQIYKNRKWFREDFNLISSSSKDQICIISAGVTLHEVIEAKDVLGDEGVEIRVIDLFRISQIDGKKLFKDVGERTVLTVEDHYKAGGIFEAVCSALSEFGARVHGLYVPEVPRSGSFEELYEKYHLNSSGIIMKVKEILSI